MLLLVRYDVSVYAERLRFFSTDFVHRIIALSSAKTSNRRIRVLELISTRSRSSFQFKVSQNHLRYENAFVALKYAYFDTKHRFLRDFRTT